MSEGKFGLSDLDLTDDLDVSMDNETYQDQSNPAPVAAGKYLATMLDLGYAKRKDGSPIKENDEYPIFRLNMIEIVAGVETQERVVDKGAGFLKDSDRVNVVKSHVE